MATPQKAPTPQSATRSILRRSSQSSSLSTPRASAINSTETGDEADESTPVEEADITMSLMGDQAVDLETPTKLSRELLAGLQIQSQEAEKNNDFAMSNAIKQKISELENLGWRPEEEDYAALDEDDDYNDVDYVNDADESHKTARLDNEKARFLAGQMDRDAQSRLARRLSLNTNGTDDFDEDEMDLTILDQFDFAALDEAQSLDYLLDREHEAKHRGWIQEDQESETSFQERTDTQRRVRFEDDIDGSDAGSVDSDQVAETFPDLFMEVHQLGPAIQQMTEEDFFLDDGSDTGSCWDFDGDEMHLDLEAGDDEEDDEASDESEGASSGYDSDDGETTDEEAPPPPATLRRNLESQSSIADSQISSTSTVKSANTPNRVTKRKASTTRSTSPRMPTAGTFILDPRRPVLLVDGAGSSQRNTFYPAKIQTQEDRRFWQRMQHLYRNKTSSPRTSVQLTPEDESDFDPLSATGTPNGFFDLFGSLRGDQVIGPPEAFMPFTNIEAQGNVTEDNFAASGSGDEEDEDDILALVNFDSDSDDEDEAPEESDSHESPFVMQSSFPHLSKGYKQSADDLLAHLDRNRGLVGSFRRNQHFAKQIGSMASHPGVRASTSEMNAMQAGRRSAGNTPITPLRKKRASIGKDVGSKSSPTTASPLPKTSNKKRGPVRGGFGGRR